MCGLTLSFLPSTSIRVCLSPSSAKLEAVCFAHGRIYVEGRGRVPVSQGHPAAMKTGNGSEPCHETLPVGRLSPASLWIPQQPSDPFHKIPCDLQHRHGRPVSPIQQGPASYTAVSRFVFVASFLARSSDSAILGDAQWAHGLDWLTLSPGLRHSVPYV